MTEIKPIIRAMTVEEAVRSFPFFVLVLDYTQTNPLLTRWWGSPVEEPTWTDGHFAHSPTHVVGYFLNFLAITPLNDPFQRILTTETTTRIEWSNMRWTVSTSTHSSSATDLDSALDTLPATAYMQPPMHTPRNETPHTTNPK